MARLFRRKGSKLWWIDYTTNGKRFRTSSGTEKRKHAAALLLKLEAAAFESEHFPKPKDRSLSELRDFWVASKHEKKTIDKDKWHFKTLIGIFGPDKSCTSFTVDDILILKTTLRKRDWKPASINRTLEVLRAALRAAELPVPKIQKLEERNERDRICTPAELKRLLLAAEGNLKLLIRLAYETGMRLGEIVSLKWSQVDLEAGVIRLHAANTKTYKPRLVPLTQNAITALREYEQSGPRIFPTLKNSQSISSRFSRLVRKLKIPDLHAHDLRHTALTRLRRAGLEIFTIAAISGHKDLKMLRRYQTIDESDLRAAIQKVEQL